MRRTRVRWGRLVGLALMAALVPAVAGRAAGDAPPPGPPSRIVVRPGDTLWSIAGRAAGPEGDPRPVVDAIRRANGIGPSELVPGMRLAVPSR